MAEATLLGAMEGLDLFVCAGGGGTIVFAIAATIIDSFEANIRRIILIVLVVLITLVSTQIAAHQHVMARAQPW